MIVKARPDNWAIPCGVAVTSVSSDSLTVALCSRGVHTVNQSTSLVVQKESNPAPGKVYRASNDWMTVDVTVDGRNFSVVGGSAPLLIVPCCVLWLAPSYTPFTSSSLPDPPANAGWERETDWRTRRIIYRGFAPGQTSGESVTTMSGPARLRCVNGLSPSDLQVQADGGGLVALEPDPSAEEGETGYVLTFKPALRDTSDEGRRL